MKVKFRLNAKQAKIAQTLAKQHKPSDQDLMESTFVKCGDFFVHDSGYGVKQQDVWLTDNSLVYEGGRTTLHYGCLDAMKGVIEKIYGSRQAAQDALISYESSAPYLDWWEMETDGISRATVERLCVLMSARYSGIQGDAIREAIRRLNNIGWKTGMTEKKMAANFNSSELKQIRHLIAAASAAGCTFLVAE